MMPNKHFIWGLSFCAALFIVGIKIPSLIIILAATILIDVDHLFYYMVRYKSCNLFKMNKYFTSDSDLEDLSNLLPVFIFHNFETMSLLLLASFISPIFAYILAGVILHMLLDWKVMPTPQYPGVIKLSLIGVILANKKRGKNR